MSLDIHLLTGVRPATPEESDARFSGLSDDMRRFRPSNEFPAAVRGLVVDQFYVGFMNTARPNAEEGWTSCTCHSWCKYRDLLSQFVLGLPAEEVWARTKREPEYIDRHPAAIVIDFTDCDGVLGPAAIASLAPVVLSVRLTFPEWLQKECSSEDARWFGVIHANFCAALSLAMQYEESVSVLLFA